MNIINVKNVGCLKEINKEINLGKNVFIYGLNGSGKTTLKEMFTNAFKSNEAAELTATFGKKKSNCTSHVKIFNKDIIYDKCKLSRNNLKNIQLNLYDNDYVENSIFLNGIISDNNQKEYYRIMVGENINQKIILKINICKELQEDIEYLKEKINSIKSNYLVFDELMDYISQSNNILNEEINIRFAINKVIKRKILRNINKLNKKNIEWLKFGNNIRKNVDICPFCGQIISTNINEDLISHYSEIYTESEEVLNEVNNNIDILINKINTLKDIIIYHNNYDVKPFIDELIGQLYLKKEDLSSKLNVDYNNFMSNIMNKKKYFDKFIEDYDNLLNLLDIKDIFTIAEVSETYSNDTYNDVENLKSRFNTYNFDEEFIKINKEKLTNICKNNIKLVKSMNEIAADQENKIAENIKFINEKLNLYGFKYHIEQGRKKQKNLKRSSDAMMGLKLIPNEYSNVNKDFEKDNLKNILSEGEKVILSWVFFLLELHQNIDKGRHFIVIDDPISSYDSYRRFFLAKELKDLISTGIDCEILLLSHEKSFSNVILGSGIKFNVFNMIDGVLTNTDISKIYESNIQDDLIYIKNLKSVDNYEDLLIYLIRSRNIIEYFIKFLEDYKPTSKSLFKQKLDKNYELVSKIIHLKTFSLPISYTTYIANIVKRMTTLNININFDLDLDNIDFDNLLNNISNPYEARVLINKELLELLENNHVEIDEIATTGDLLNLANKKGILDSKYYKICNLYLPLLNVYNHPNENFGLRRIDCNEIKLERLYIFLNNNHDVRKNN